MKIEQIGNITLASDYWDCACETEYIHHKSETKCSKCGQHEYDCPDSRLEEVKVYLERNSN